MVLLLVGFPFSDGNNRVLRLVDEWKSVDFEFPSTQLRQEAIFKKDFIPGMAVPIDVDVHYNGCELTDASVQCINIR